MTIQQGRSGSDDLFTGIATKNNAFTILKHLQDQESNRARMHTRWIWELLQNARDASKESDNQLIVSIKYELGELVFSHNGGGFTKEQIAHLILHGSTKVEDEETIGKYGSGFLTTHLLSPEVNISGKLDDGQGFDFRLVRKPDDSADTLSESMFEAWKRFVASLAPQGAPTRTQFKYPIVGGSAVEAVEQGIETLKQYAPLVVVFNREFSIINIEMSGETTRFEVPQHDPIVDCGIQSIQMIKNTDQNQTEMKYHLAQDKSKQAVVAVPLKWIGESYECLSLEKTPRLFLGFPLVGTEDFSFPAVINSLGFYPREERDGIYLGQSEDLKNDTNEKVIKEACELLVDLLQSTASKEWNHIHRWAEVPTIKENKEWFRECIGDHFAKKIREIPLILTKTGEAIAPKDACLPSAKESEKIPELWDLFNGLKEQSELLPRREEAIAWCNTVKGWAEVQDKPLSAFPELHDCQKLASNIEKHAKLGDYRIEALQQLLQENVLADHWLRQFCAFLESNGFDNEIRKRHLVLSQSRGLKPLSKLYRDRDIDEELKKITGEIPNVEELSCFRIHRENTPSDFWLLTKLAEKESTILLRDKLIDKRFDEQFTSLAEKESAGHIDNENLVKSLLTYLGDLQERFKYGQKHYDIFKKTSTRLFAWLVSHEKWHHLRNIPIFMKDSNKSYHSLRSAFDNNIPPLAPIRAWPEDLQPFSDLFPPHRILADNFFEEMNDPEAWKNLGEQGLIRREIISSSKEKNLKELSPDVYDDEEDHETAEPICVIDFVERSAIMNRVSDSKERAYLFWRFITEWLIKNEKIATSLRCEKQMCESCKQHHTLYPAAWLKPIRKNGWIRETNRRSSPNASSLANLLSANGWEPSSLSSLKENPDVDKLLKALDIPFPDLSLQFIDEEKRGEVVTLATKLISLENSELISLENSENLDLVLEEVKKKQERERAVQENKNLGHQVEDIVGEILSQEGFKVKSNHKGWDFEITDHITELQIDQENSDNSGKSWLIEVKSTRTQNEHRSVRMSSAQVEEAVKHRKRYLLCVVPLEPEHTEPNSEIVRENMRFIKNIGDRIESLHEDLVIFEELKDDITTDAPDFQLVVEHGNAGICVKAFVWERDGFHLKDLVEYLK